MLFRSQSATMIIAVLLSMAVPARAAEGKRTLLQRADPVYPEIARRMHVGGSILLQLSILPDGSVNQVVPQSGHPLLVRAAEDAVRRWKYAASPETTTAIVKVDFQIDF